MAATAAARQGAMGLTRRMMLPVTPAKPLDSFRLINQAGLVSRSFSIRACSSPQIRSSIRSMYGLSTFSSVRTFSLWPSSDKFASSGSNSSALEPSPDARASQTEQVGDFANISTPDLSAFESATGPTIHDMGSNISEAVEHVQTLADLGRLSSWPNVRAVQWLLDGTVEMTGLPWWSVIVLVTISIRILVLPLVFKGQANAIRLQNIQPKMGAYMKDIQYAKTTGNKVLLSDSALAVQKLMKDNNCSPFKSLLTPVVLMPIFASFFFALRGLGAAGITSMQNGGLSWFSDLTIPDPYYILPVASIFMSLAVLETGAEMGSSQKAVTPQAKMMRNVLRGLTVLSIPILVYFPAAVFCYMATNNTFSLIQLVVLQQPIVRRALNLPEKIEHEPEEENKAKPMGLWDSVKAGTASQTSASVISRNRVPSALKTNRQIEEGREAALRGIMQQQQQQPRRTERPIINASTSLDSAVDAPLTESDRSEVYSLETEPQYDAEEADRQARIREKQKRVQAARQKRVKKQ